MKDKIMIISNRYIKKFKIIKKKENNKKDKIEDNKDPHKFKKSNKSSQLNKNQWNKEFMKQNKSQNISTYLMKLIGINLMIPFMLSIEDGLIDGRIIYPMIISSAF